MSLAAEVELRAVFINVKQPVIMRTALQEMGHHQPPTPIKTDSSTTYGIITNKIMPKVMKACSCFIHVEGK